MSEVNIKSTTIEKGLDVAKDFLVKVFGPTADEIGLLMSDNVKMWRLKNQLRNFEKVKKIVNDKNITIKQVNLKVLLPYLEGVSMEEDDTLQDLWANLFANYLDSSKNLILTVYPSILKQLSTNEIRILEFMVAEKGAINFMETPFDWSDSEICNLERLGLIKDELNLKSYASGSGFNSEPNIEIEELASEKYYLTQFGMLFLDGCNQTK